MTRLADHESVFCTDRHTHTHTDILTEDIYIIYIYMHARICVHTTRTTGINSKAFFTILGARARSLFTPLLINHECTRGLSARNVRRLPSTFTRARLIFSFFFSHKMDFRRLVNRPNPRIKNVVENVVDAHTTDYK